MRAWVALGGAARLAEMIPAWRPMAVTDGETPLLH